MGFLPMRDNQASWHMIYAHSEADCVAGAIDWLPQPRGVSTGGRYSHVEAHPCLTQQRISLPLQRADHRPDTPALNQPISVASSPLATCSSQECVELVRTTHDDLAALLADLARSDMRREVDRPRHQSFGGGAKFPEVVSASLEPRCALLMEGGYAFAKVV